MSNKYHNWKKRVEQYNEFEHGPITFRNKKREDYSCKICHPQQYTNKRFKRFWKWYSEEIPEAIDYSGKTEDMLHELLKCINSEIKEERKRIREYTAKVISYIRYFKSPEKTEKEIAERIMEMILASDNFEKSVKKSKETWEEYLSSEESRSEISFEEKQEENDWYETTQENLAQHIKLVHIQKQELNEENSSITCQLCYKIIKEEINKEFIEFWEWYENYLPAQMFNENTIQVFKEIKNEKHPAKLIQGTIGIVLSVIYHKKPELSFVKIQRRLGRLMTLRAHENLTFEEAVKREEDTIRELELSEISGESTKDESPEKNDSPKEIKDSETTFIEELDKELREIGKIVTIKCGNYGPYEVTGKGNNYEIEFIDEDNYTEIISEDDFKDLCNQEGLNVEEILEEIRNFVNRKIESEIRTEYDKYEGTDIEYETEDSENEAELEENIFVDHEENIINIPENLPSTPSEDSDLSEEIEIEEMAL